MPLGLPITNLGGVGGPLAMGDTGGSVVIEDYYWELVDVGSGGGFDHLWPKLQGTVIPNIHDTWDLLTISIAGNYQPKTVATVSDEGWWDVQTISTGNDGIKPLPTVP